MTNATDVLIEEFTKEALFLGEAENKEAQYMAARARLAVSTLRSFRDTLIAIAQNQGPVPSHQAKDVLIEAGNCGHLNQIFRAETPNIDAHYLCPECSRLDKNKMVPFS